MILAFFAVVFGLALLIWSADWFVEGSASTARHFAVPPLLIGMVIVGFGTSAPEIMISALASYQENPGISLGNAYGSNISNIALILGLTALISPIAVHSRILRKELPILAVVTAVAAWQLRDNEITRTEAIFLLSLFVLLMAWTIVQGLQNRSDPLASGIAEELALREMPIRTSVYRLILGLIFLIISSRILLWGAIRIAQGFGVSDLIIGLTIVAVGTSLPELASSIAAARKREHDIALGNILGSNLFNTLAVVGLAGLIRPLAAAPEVFQRDVPVMGALTLLLFILGCGFRRPGRINRLEGLLLVICYLSYTIYLIAAAANSSSL